MHQTIAAVGIAVGTLLLLIVNFRIALRSLRYSYYFSNFLIVVLGIIMSALMYERVVLKVRANAFALDFVSAKGRDVVLSEGLILRSVTKSGNRITYRYLANNVATLPTFSDAVENNCNDMAPRLLLEYGFTIEHVFWINGIENSSIVMRADFC